jgi:hypothetical protein
MVKLFSFLTIVCSFFIAGTFILSCAKSNDNTNNTANTDYDDISWGPDSLTSIDSKSPDDSSKNINSDLLGLSMDSTTDKSNFDVKLSDMPNVVVSGNALAKIGDVKKFDEYITGDKLDAIKLREDGFILDMVNDLIMIKTSNSETIGIPIIYNAMVETTIFVPGPIAPSQVRTQGHAPRLTTIIATISALAQIGNAQNFSVYISEDGRFNKEWLHAAGFILKEINGKAIITSDITNSIPKAAIVETLKSKPVAVPEVVRHLLFGEFPEWIDKMSFLVSHESGAEIRNAPLLDSELLGIIPNGTVLESNLRSKSKEDDPHWWYETTYEDRSGWVYSEFLKKNDYEIID